MPRPAETANALCYRTGGDSRSRDRLLSCPSHPPAPNRRCACPEHTPDSTVLECRLESTSPGADIIMLDALRPFSVPRREGDATRPEFARSNLKSHRDSKSLMRSRKAGHDGPNDCCEQWPWGERNYLFAAADCGGERAGTMCGLIGSITKFWNRKSTCSSASLLGRL